MKVNIYFRLDSIVLHRNGRKKRLKHHGNGRSVQGQKRGLSSEWLWLSSSNSGWDLFGGFGWNNSSISLAEVV